MPRRRASKGRAAVASAPRSKGKRGSSVQRWNAREDIPLDEVDQFQEQRDRILLEGEEDTGDSDGADEEVFALRGVEASSSDDDVDDVEEDDDEVEEEEVVENDRKLPKAKSSKKASKKTPQSSSEESSEDEEEEESWGRKKSVYYSSNAAQLESDDEEAHEMEEQEARRLQAKLREPMREEDFGYGDALERNIASQDADDLWNPVEKPSNEAPVAQDKTSLIRHLQKTSPETLALAQEWDLVAYAITKTGKKLSQLDVSNPQQQKSLGLVYLHRQTQLTYAALLAFYLHLRASERYSAKPELLRQHPILKRLLTLKQSLITLEDQQFNLSDSEDEVGEDEMYGKFNDGESDIDDDELEQWLATRSKGLDVGELQELLEGTSATSLKNTSRKKSKPSPKKKPSSDKNKTQPNVVFDVEEPKFVKSTRKSPSTHTSVDPYGESASLDLADAEDKGVRRKALRFHTAKIESASARRQGARTAMGGDDDIPYRDRRKQDEKQKRRDLGAGGDDLDGAEPEAPSKANKRRREDVSDDEDSKSEDEDGYYSLVKKQKKDLKTKKKAEYEAEKSANRVELGDDVTSGQRSVSRAILANKGLTPKRSKSVRNPRLKKRLKFEKAKKKLASQKAVYKGGNETGYYDGERSGISKVVKSVKI